MIDHLESRIHLDCTLDTKTSTLLCTGTAGNDSFNITLEGNELKVTIDKQDQPRRRRRFRARDVKKIRADGGAKNDVIKVPMTLNIPLFADGGSGNDRLIGGAKNDRLLGGKGDDTVTANGGNDLVSGGPGLDNVHGGPGTDTAKENVSGTIFFTPLGSGPALDNITEPIVDVELLNLRGSNGNDFIDPFQFPGRVTLFGLGGDDVLNGSGAGNDVLNGGPGNDELIGWGGDDKLDGADGIDVVNGELGNDTCFGETLFNCEAP